MLRCVAVLCTYMLFIFLGLGPEFQIFCGVHSACIFCGLLQTIVYNFI